MRTMSSTVSVTALELLRGFPSVRVVLHCALNPSAPSGHELSTSATPPERLISSAPHSFSTLKRFPINYLSSLIGLFLDLSSLPERLVTLALFSSVLHLVLAFRTPSRPLVLDPVDSCRLLGLGYSALHGPDPSWDCRRVLHTRTPPNELDRHDPSGRGLHSSRCTRLNCEVLCMLLTLQLLQVLQCGIH